MLKGIELSTTYAQSAPGEHLGFEYSRSSNPTRVVLEELVANVERNKTHLLFFFAYLCVVLVYLFFFFSKIRKLQPKTKQKDAKYGLGFASGSAATASILSILQSGDHIITVDDVYGGTNRYRAITHFFLRFCEMIMHVCCVKKNNLKVHFVFLKTCSTLWKIEYQRL